MKVETKLTELGLAVPDPSRSIAPTPPARTTSRTTQCRTCSISPAPRRAATDGLISPVSSARITLEQGYEAARYAVLTTLAAVKYALGELDRVQQIVHLLGFVNSAPGFSDQPRVINGAADLLVQLFGERGKPTRAAIGCQGLGGNASVEIVVTLLFSGSEVRPPLARDHFVK